jgi:hypothetical protein
MHTHMHAEAPAYMSSECRLSLYNKHGELELPRNSSEKLLHSPAESNRHDDFICIDVIARLSKHISDSSRAKQSSTDLVGDGLAA